MTHPFKRRLVIVSIVYWILLLYIIAALIWWFIALENQNKQMVALQLSELKKDDPSFQAKYKQISVQEETKNAQYIGEGITFLALTMIGALFVYRAAHRQIRLQQQQENFMMAVTHELKTPIAIAKLNLETLQKHHLDESKTQKLLLATLQETNRLDSLASNVLVSAQLEGGKYRIAKEEFDLSELIKSSFNEYKSRFPERRWQLGLEPDLDLEGDSILLTMLINNLLENAIKYSPKDGLITCNLVKKNNHIILNVTDEGPGIPDSEKKKVFGKFYRIGNEDTRTTKGTGLGLYLCKRIAKDHNATVRIMDNSPSGCNFIISFTS
jgi:two-component system sensor histidine kinase CiaH